MGNDSLLLALAASGPGVSPATLHSLAQMRQRNYQKLAAFVRWLATVLTYGWFWLKKRPEILGTDGKPDYSGQGTQALLDAFWQRQDQKDFVANLIREGADLVLEWLKPDESAWNLWQPLLTNPAPAALLPDLASTQLTALQQLLSQLGVALPGSAPGLLPTSAEAAPGTRRPEAAPIDRSAVRGSATNPVVSRTGGL